MKSRLRVSEPKYALPKQDEFGNYWLGRRGKAPAILHSGVQLGKFMVLLAGSGLMFDSGGIRYFDSPEDALSAFDE